MNKITHGSHWGVTAVVDDAASSASNRVRCAMRTLRRSCADAGGGLPRCRVARPSIAKLARQGAQAGGGTRGGTRRSAMGRGTRHDRRGAQAGPHCIRQRRDLRRLVRLGERRPLPSCETQLQRFMGCPAGSPARSTATPSPPASRSCRTSSVTIGRSGTFPRGTALPRTRSCSSPSAAAAPRTRR